MKKKLFAFTLSFCLAFTMLFPIDVLATDETRDLESGSIEEPYMTQSLATLYDAGMLVLPEAMAAKAEVKHDGLFIKDCPKADLTADKIQIAANFDFSEGTVGRIAVDGLGDRNMKVSVEIYLDDAEEPVATVPLKNQMGKTGWNKVATNSIDALAKGISGSHDVFLRIIDESTAADDEELSVLIRSIEFAENSLPVLWFDIDETQGTVAAMNNDENHDTECYGKVTVQIPDGYQCEYKPSKPVATEELELDYIRGRGNSTWWSDKKPYKVKLKDKTNLFNMGKNRHWVLLANRYDNSAMRNKMTYWLGEQLGLDYTPQCVQVEVVMDGDYYGTYLLTEQIRVGKDRVEIDDLEDEDTGGPDVTEGTALTGGYLLSMNPDGEEPTYKYNAFSTKNDVNFFLEHPSFEDYKNDYQIAYIKDFMQRTEDAILGKNFKNAAGESYQEYLDMDAAVDYFWVQEFSRNGDAYGSGSTYLYKTRDKENEDGSIEKGKVFWGPLWDFDYVAWGDLEYDDYSVDNLHYTCMTWFDRMRSDKDFSDRVIARWPYLKSFMEEITCEGGLLDQYYEQLRVAKKYDLERWGSYGEGGGYGYGEESSEPEQRSLSEEVEQLRGWINARTNYVDENLQEIIPAQYTIKFKANKKVIATRVVSQDETIGSLPTAPSKDGYYFMGWYMYSEKITADWLPYSDMTVTAKYVKKSEAVKAKKIYLNTYSTMCMLEDEFFELEHLVKPANAYYSKINWKSSDSSIATVDEQGCVTFKKPGTVTITASIKNGPSATCKIKIVKDYEDVVWRDGFHLSKSSLKLSKGNYAQIRVINEPAVSRYSYVTWLSGDTKIATVNDYGVVTAKKPGTTYVFAIDTENGNIEKCKVTVLKLKNPMKVKGKTVTVKYSKLKKKSQVIKRTKAIKITKKKGTLTYTKVKGNKKIKVNKKTGKITVKKGLKKRTYIVKIKVTAKSTKTYRKTTKIATVRIKVK